MGGGGGGEQLQNWEKGGEGGRKGEGSSSSWLDCVTVKSTSSREREMPPLQLDLFFLSFSRRITRPTMSLPFFIMFQYLDRHAITDLSRENFTFNTKVNVGQFYEIRDKQVVSKTVGQYITSQTNYLVC